MRRQRLGGPAPQVRDPRVTDLRGADSWESRRYPAAAVYDANSLLFLILFKALKHLSKVIFKFFFFLKNTALSYDPDLFRHG
jgi:hypothetical protein